MRELLRPPAHYPPDSLRHSLMFYARLLIDFQVGTVFSSMKDYLPHVTGKIVDIGCGQSPYRFLIGAHATHIGVDIYDSNKFGYQNKKAIPFNGKSLPFRSASIDHFICTETLEHVPEPTLLIKEIHRILKEDGDGVVTIPWSARFHYIPYDYFRFTPSALENLFKSFREIEVVPRGTDLVVIASKIITVYSRLFLSSGKFRILRISLGFVLFPFTVIIMLFGHLCLLLKLGAQEDPLGYTVHVRK